jgi:hypothetical protein
MVLSVEWNLPRVKGFQPIPMHAIDMHRVWPDKA